MIRVLPFVVSAMVAAGTMPSAAQSSAPGFLPTAQVVKVLADGRLWSAEAENRPRARMTFNSDGTGLFEGPGTMPMSWEIKGQDVCLNLRIVGVRCLRFRQVAGGFEGYLGQTLDLKLSR
jgi:hypothetical protein